MGTIASAFSRCSVPGVCVKVCVVVGGLEDFFFYVYPVRTQQQPNQSLEEEAVNVTPSGMSTHGATISSAADAHVRALVARLNAKTVSSDKAAMLLAAAAETLALPLPPVAANRSHAVALDCTNPRYADIFSGAQRSTPAMIVDFVPFGYDLDQLEVRLLEGYQHVHAFVVYEAPFTQQGTPKPLFYKRARERFARFRHQVIHLVATAASAKRAQRTLEAFRAGRRDWHTEKQMRTEIVELFRSSSHPLAVMARAAGTGVSVLALQNDADEISSEATLLHLKHCAPKPGRDLPWYVPTTAYKLSYHFVQRTFDRLALGATWAKHMGNSVHRVRDSTVASTPSIEALQPMSQALPELAKYAWAPGPTVHALEDVLRRGALPRYILTANAPQLGPAAATHLSSVAEPAREWFKAAGIIEGSGINQTLSEELRKALRTRRVTPGIVISGSPGWCQPRNNAVHVRKLGSRARKLLLEALPWAVREHPERYPFLLPAKSAPHCCWAHQPREWDAGRGRWGKRITGGKDDLHRGDATCCFEWAGSDGLLRDAVAAPVHGSALFFALAESELCRGRLNASPAAGGVVRRSP